MKREKEMPNSNSASGRSQSAPKKSNTKRIKGVVPDNSTGATQRVRSKHGHGLNNEGTNVNYEEER